MPQGRIMNRGGFDEFEDWNYHSDIYLARDGLQNGSGGYQGFLETGRNVGVRLANGLGSSDRCAGTYGGSWLDPLICLSHAAACTEKIKLGTHILVVPLRHPVLLAKEIATLDYISAGRFFLGVGPGWSEPEFDAMGIPLKERGQRTDEILDALKLLLTQKNVTFNGRFYQFKNVTIDPMPPRYPEVWVAGGSRIPDALSPTNPTW